VDLDYGSGGRFARERFCQQARGPLPRVAVAFGLVRHGDTERTPTLGPERRLQRSLGVARQALTFATNPIDLVDERLNPFGPPVLACHGIFMEQTTRRRDGLWLGLLLLRNGLINFSPEVLALPARQLGDAVAGLDHPFRPDKADVPAARALASDRHSVFYGKARATPQARLSRSLAVALIAST
jgi:hypothetical protein